MTLGSAASTRSSDPQVRELQEQFESVLAGQAPSRANKAHADKAAAAPATLLRQLPLDVPLVMEVGMLVVRLLRRSPDSVKGKQAARPASESGRSRRRLVRPVLVVVAALGAAYAVSRVVSRPGGSAGQPARPAADPAVPRRGSRPRVRVT